MAILGRITVNEILILEVDADPSIEGVSAPSGSIAVMTDGSGIFHKGEGDQFDWVDRALTHVSRHLPNGADALTTAAAITQTPDQANAVGVANSLSRSDHTHNIPTATPSSTGTANSQGTADSFARSDHVHNTILTRHQITANTEVQTTAPADVLLSGMSLQAAITGQYIVFAQVSTRNTSANTSNIFSIYVNGTKLTNSEDSILRGGNQANISGRYIFFDEISLTASQTVDIRWRVDGGVGQVYSRSLQLIKVA